MTLPYSPIDELIVVVGNCLAIYDKAFGASGEATSMGIYVVAMWLVKIASHMCVLH